MHCSGSNRRSWKGRKGAAAVLHRCRLDPHQGSGTYDSYRIAKEEIQIGEDVPFPPEL
jgi:hypothetical protein